VGGRGTVSRKRAGQDARLELTMAAEEIEAGELARAGTRVSNVLVREPALPEAHKLLARLAAHPRGGLRLFPLTDPLSLATVVARAHVAAAEGDFTHALGLLGKAQAFAPQTAWADVPWMTAAATAAAADPAVVANLAIDLLELLRSGDTAELRPAMGPYLQLVRNTIAAHPDHVSLLGAAGYLVRRFSPAEAAGYAARADDLAPSSASAIALGLIYRDLGRTDDAARAMERALRLDPGNLEVHADLCDLLLDADRLDEALACARRALAIDPGYTCCQIAALAVQFRQGRQAADLDDLIQLCQAQPAGTHARRHGDQILASTVTKTANRTTTIHGSPDDLLRQARRFTDRRSG
jgi:tetratricopeptide (TPR) repeat protein